MTISWTDEMREDAKRRTMAGWIIRLKDPAQGINVKEMREVLEYILPGFRKVSVKQETATVQQYIVKLPEPGRGTGLSWRKNELGVQLNLFWLSDRAQFDRWAAMWTGYDLPEWWLDEPEAIMTLDALVNDGENR